MLLVSKKNPHNSPVILIGDFNMENTKPHNQQYFESILSPTQLYGALPNNTITTIYNSYIDVIYTNKPMYNACVYTTFYSDHFAVYIQLLTM